MASLFDPLHLRDLTLENRILVSPMCQYSCTDGFATDWHLVHLGSRAVGGAALVFTEACAVRADGRISPSDLGIYRDAHTDMLGRIVRFVHSQSSAAGVQLAHAGRKASTAAPWLGGGKVDTADGGWDPVGPTAAPFDSTYPVPTALTTAEIDDVVAAFRRAASRALDAGFDVVEIHVEALPPEDGPVGLHARPDLARLVGERAHRIMRLRVRGHFEHRFGVFAGEHPPMQPQGARYMNAPIAIKTSAHGTNAA